MGFYIRKSINVGPVRFNLSGSGIGVSTGIKGFRVGTGPRGNYVSMGYGGIYFRQTLPNSTRQESFQKGSEVQASGIEMREIDSGDVAQMVDSSSAALLEEINSKSQKIRIWPWVLGFSVCLILLMATANASTRLYFLVIPACTAILVWAVHADKMRKTVVLFYQLEPHIEAAYQNVHNIFDMFKKCSRMWHIESRGDVRTTYDWKVNAGADTLVRRKTVGPKVGAPPYFQSNISIPILPAGRQLLYFLPDRILVWDTQRVGAIGYEQLEINFGDQQFIESSGVPHDARVIGKTWRYVNKKGGPDKRFNNNYEIPIAIYEAMLLTSNSGLRELFQISRTGISKQFEIFAKDMSSAISQRIQQNTEANYIKCPCNNCDIHIEFPIDGIGQTIICPHCGLETVLFRPNV